MKEFITSNELMKFNFYGITFRLNVILVDDVATTWFVTVRTCNKENEKTWEYQNSDDAFKKFKELVKEKI